MFGRWCAAGAAWAEPPDSRLLTAPTAATRLAAATRNPTLPFTVPPRLRWRFPDHPLGLLTAPLSPSRVMGGLSQRKDLRRVLLRQSPLLGQLGLFVRALLYEWRRARAQPYPEGRGEPSNAGDAEPELRPAGGRQPAGQDPARRAAPCEGEEVDADHAPTQMIGGRELDERVRIRRPGREAEAGEEEEESRHQSRAHGREQQLAEGKAHAAEHGRPHRRPAHVRRDQRAEQRSAAEDAREQPEDLRPGMEGLLRQHREQDVEVETERAHDEDEGQHQPDLLVAAGEANAFLQAREDPRALTALKGMELLGPHHHQPRKHGHVADGVDAETEPCARRRDEHSAERRAEDPRPVEQAGVQTDRVRQLSRPDHAEGERLARGRIQHLHEPHQRGDHVHVPGARDTRQRDRGDRRREKHLRHLSADHGSPRVEPVHDHARHKAEERERHELAERQDPDRDRRVGEREDEPGLRNALHPRAGHGDDLADEEEPVVPVPADAEEGSCAGAQDRRRHAVSASRRLVSGSIAASITSSSSGSRWRSRSASHAVRFDFTERRTRWPAGVTIRPTRRRSPATGARSISPASSSRVRNFDMPGTDIRSREASSRTPIPGAYLIWTRSETWTPVTPSEWISRRSSRLSLRSTGRRRLATAVVSRVSASISLTRLTNRPYLASALSQARSARP